MEQMRTAGSVMNDRLLFRTFMGFVCRKNKYA